MEKIVYGKEKIAFGMAAFNSYMVAGFASTYILYFYTDILIVPALFVTLLMTVARIWDAINDPIMGMIIERTNTVYGKMRPYLKYGALPMGAIIVLLFTPVGGSVAFRMVYASVTYIIFGMLYTLVEISFLGMISVATTDTKERASLLSFYVTIGSVGVLVPMALIPIFTEMFSQKWGYFAFALLAGLYCYYVIKNLFNRSAERMPQDLEKVPRKEIFQVVLKNKPMILAILSSMICCTRYLLLVAAIYVSAYVIQIGSLSAEAVLLILFVVVGVGMFAGILSTPLLYKYFGYKPTYIFYGIFGFITLGVAFFIDYSNLYIIFPLMFLGGISLGGYNVLPYPMTGDSLDYLEWKTGKRMEGICFSINSFATKFNNAFGAIGVSLTLVLIKFVQPEVAGEQMPQTDSTIRGIYALVTLIPAIGFGLSIIPMFFYDYYGEKKQKILEELRERKEKCLNSPDACDLEFFKD